jgi:hypothetical protein
MMEFVIWLVVGFVILVARLRFDDHFGGWVLMMADPTHGKNSVRACIAILVALVVFCPAHLLIMTWRKQ